MRSHLYLYKKGVTYFMKYLMGKIADRIKEYYEKGEITNSTFLDPSEIIEIMPALKNITYVLYGGYDDAERRIALIGTEDVEEASNFLSIIRVSSHSGEKLSHRSILGSVLGLGVKREMMGDILIGNEYSDIIVLKSITEFLENNLKYVGREKVKVQVVSLHELQEIQEETKEIRTSVSSLRLDSVISNGFGMAREKSTLLVKGEAVKLNHMIVKSPSKPVKEGDLISVRGKRKINDKRGFGANKKRKNKGYI